MSKLTPNSPNFIGRGQAKHPDMNIAIEYFVSNEGEVCVFHDNPFSKTLSWFEYTPATQSLDFIMEDGDIRNFGIPVAAELAPYFQDAQQVSVIRINPETDDVLEGADLPLINHSL